MVKKIGPQRGNAGGADKRLQDTRKFGLTSFTRIGKMQNGENEFGRDSGRRCFFTALQQRSFSVNCAILLELLIIFLELL